MAGHPTDALVEDLFDLYAANIARLEGIVAAGLRRGIDPERLGQPGAPRGTATAAYRKRQLEQATAIADELFRTGTNAGPILIERAYRSGLVTVDRVLNAGPPRAAARGAFGRVHVRAVEALAGNLSRSLENGARAIGDNVALVFERADALDGALPNAPAGRTVGGLRFLGRRVNDPYRALALETVAGGVIGLDTRRQVSATLARRLVTEGVTDAITGFVDRAGRRWPLHTYAAMVAQTTTREAMTAGTANRLREHGTGLVTISSHAHQADECTPYDGRTFSLDGDDAGYPRLDRLPPFHPRCGHVLTPAAANLDRFVAELEQSVNAERGEHPQPRTITPTEPPAPPFSSYAEPTRGPDTADRLELQRLIDADPGPDPDAVAARIADLDTDASTAAARAAEADQARAAIVEDETRKARRARRAALRDLMSPELATELGFKRGTRPKQWAADDDVVERLEAGELTLDDVEQLAYEHYESLEERRAVREVTAEANYGTNTKPLPCFSCGRLKALPADICEFCGDDPLALGETAADFNAAYGYTGVGTESRKAAGSFRGGHGAKRERTGEWNG